MKNKNLTSCHIAVTHTLYTRVCESAKRKCVPKVNILFLKKNNKNKYSYKITDHKTTEAAVRTNTIKQ